MRARRRARWRAVCFLAALLSAHGASASPPVVELVFAKSLGGVSLGLTRAQVEKLGYRLTPEQHERATDDGFVSGPFTFLFDRTTKKTTFVGIELQRTGGLRVGKRRVPARTTLDELVKVLSGCQREEGGLGATLTCTDAQGHTLVAVDDFSLVVWLHLTR